MKFVKLKDVKTPERGTPRSAGLDFFTPEEFNPLMLAPNESVLIPSGIAIEIPKGYCLTAEAKSRLGSKGLIPGACLIDEDYQGEIHLNMWNVSKEPIEIKPGQKLVQMVLYKVDYPILHEVKTKAELFPAKSIRGEGGFGSTGK